MINLPNSERRIKREVEAENIELDGEKLGTKEVEVEKNTVSLNESLIIDLITNKPTIDYFDDDNDVTQVVELKEQTNVNQEADFQLTFNVKNDLKEEIERMEITEETTTTTPTTIDVEKSVSLFKDIEEKNVVPQQQIKMQIYNNNEEEKESNQYLNYEKSLLKNDDSITQIETDIDVNFMSMSTENILAKNHNDDNKDVGHNADNYWTKSNRLDNVNDKGATEATEANYFQNNNNNNMDNDYLIETTTTITSIIVEKENIEEEMLKVDKFILNDRQIDSKTIEKVEHNLMEINENIEDDNDVDNEDVNDNDDDVGNELNKLTPQHLLLDELMLNDGGVEEGPAKLVHQSVENNNANPYVVTNNDVLNYIDSEHENIDIVSLEKEKQPVPTNELFYKTLPAPQVMESFDKPNKRILVNVTIATDDADGSVYTLHVALPTGRGQNEEKNIEQVLTHERRLNDDGSSSPYCYPEPPPVIPESPCPCSCPCENDIETDTNTYTNEKVLETTISSTTFDTDTTLLTTTINLTKHDTDIDTTTISNMGVGTTTTTTISSACPDVMPILILEGVCYFFCLL